MSCSVPPSLAFSTSAHRAVSKHRWTAIFTEVMLGSRGGSAVLLSSPALSDPSPSPSAVVAALRQWARVAPSRSSPNAERWSAGPVRWRGWFIPGEATCPTSAAPGKTWHQSCHSWEGLVGQRWEASCSRRFWKLHLEVGVLNPSRTSPRWRGQHDSTSFPRGENSP